MDLVSTIAMHDQCMTNAVFLYSVCIESLLFLNFEIDCSLPPLSENLQENWCLPYTVITDTYKVVGAGP